MDGVTEYLVKMLKGQLESGSGSGVLSAVSALKDHLDHMANDSLYQLASDINSIAWAYDSHPMTSPEWYHNLLDIYECLKVRNYQELLAVYGDMQEWEKEWKRDKEPEKAKNCRKVSSALLRQLVAMAIDNCGEDRI